MKTAFHLLAALLVLSLSNSALAQQPDFKEIEKLIEKVEKATDSYRVTVKPEYENDLKKNPTKITLLLLLYVLREEKITPGEDHGECMATFEGRTVIFKIKLKTPRPPIKA